ncbi:hypothetical protein XarbCFBP8142_06785 [Xanthomonas arboricola]|nr:hypothetical protein XarbCFBP8142_06785 [Xanthomonas arboricola]
MRGIHAATLRGMDAAQEPTRTYLRRVPRWWAGKGPAAKSQTSRSAANAQINSIANRTHLADKPSVVSVNRIQTTCETAGVERHATSLASHVP